MARKRRNHISQRQPRDELGRFSRSTASTTSRPSSRRASTTTGPSSAHRASTTAGPSSARRASTTSESSSTRDESSTKVPTHRTSTETPAATDNGKGAGASSSHAKEMKVTLNGAETEVQISLDKLELTMIYTDDSDNEGPLLSGKKIRAKVEEIRRVIKQKVKYKMARGEMKGN